MRTKILSKLAIAQLACLPIISISCGKHEQKAKENLVAVANSPKFDKLIDKNKEERDETTPIVEKIEVVNNGEDESKQIEKSKKAEIRNQNNPNSPINVEIKNDIKFNNKINTKENKLKTFFAVIGGLATAAAVGYGLWWLFKENDVITITSAKQTNKTKEIYSDSLKEVEVEIKYNCTGNCTSLIITGNLKNGYIFTKTIQTIQNGSHTATVNIKGAEWVIVEIIKKTTSTITNISTTKITNWERFLKYLKSKFHKQNSTK